MDYSEQNLESQKPCPYENGRRVHYAPGYTGGQADKEAYQLHVAQTASRFFAGLCPRKAAMNCFLSLFTRVLKAQYTVRGNEKHSARFLF